MGTASMPSRRGMASTSRSGIARWAMRAPCGPSCRRSTARSSRTPSRRRSGASCAFQACRRSCRRTASIAFRKRPASIASSATTRCRSTSARASILRERVAAHFSGDWRSETDLRLVAGNPPHRSRGDRRRARRAAARGGAGEDGAAGAQPRAAPQGGSGRAGARRGRARASCARSMSSPRALAGGYGPFASQARRTRDCCARSLPSTRFAGSGLSSSGVIGRTVLPAPTQTLRRRMRRGGVAARARCASGRAHCRHWPFPPGPCTGAAARPRVFSSSTAGGERIDVT